MERIDMENFYKDVISYYFDEIEKEFSEYKSYFKIIKGERAIKRLHRHYQKKRADVYRYMYPDMIALDGHKVASCFIYAILKSNLIRLNRLKKTLPENLRLVNEHLACVVALNIVAMYRRNKDDKENQDGPKSQFKIKIPTTYHDVEEGCSEYLSVLSKALYYSKSALSKFDAFAYSNIMFLLEKYTDDTIKLK